MKETEKQLQNEGNIASYPAYTVVVVMLSLIAVLLIVSIAGYVSYHGAAANPSSAAEQPNAFSPAKMMMMGGMIGSLLLLAASIVYLFRVSVKPYNTLIRHAMDSIREDSTSIRKTVSGISLGDLATKITSHAVPLAQRDFPGLSQVVVKFNEIIDALHGTIQEYNFLTETACKRLCYVGGDSFLEGRKAAEVLGQMLGGHGTVAVALGNTVGPRLRKKGFENCLMERFPGIRIAAVYETLDKQDVAYERTVDVLKKNPKLDGIYVTQGGTPPAVGRAAASTRKNAIKIVSHDMMDETMKLIQQGVISATIGQDPYAQGYHPVMYLYNHICGGWRPEFPRILTSMDVATQENYSQFWSPESGLIISEQTKNRLPKPIAGTERRPLRFAVLCRDDSAFWKPMKDGVFAAAAELKSKSVQVDWHVPDAAAAAGMTMGERYSRAFTSLVSKQYDGIATLVIDNEMIPVVNTAARYDIPVVSFNCEPISLRGLIMMIDEEARDIMKISTTLTQGIAEVKIATSQISEAMNSIADGSADQNTQAVQTEKTMSALGKNIEQVSTQANESAETASNTIQVVSTGLDAMVQSVGSMQEMEKSVQSSWEIIEELNTNSRRIDDVIGLIDDIADRVNLLGLNASIEATRAGNYGRGFAIVADEIRKLAENTNQATKDITKSVAVVKNGIRQVEGVMTTGLGKVKQSSALADKAAGLLRNIQTSVADDVKRMQAIAATLVEIKTFTHSVQTAFQQVTAISEQNASSVTESSAAMSQIDSQLVEINNLTQTLDAMAQAEIDLLAKFYTGEKE